MAGDRCTRSGEGSTRGARAAFPDGAPAGGPSGGGADAPSAKTGYAAVPGSGFFAAFGFAAAAPTNGSGAGSVDPVVRLDDGSQYSAADYTADSWASLTAVRNAAATLVERGGNNADQAAASAKLQRAVDGLPDRVSALVFLNLDEIFGLAQRAGLAENPLYASLGEDISHVQSLGLAVSGSEDELRSELFLAIDE